MGQTTAINRVQLGFTTGTGDIQDLDTWNGKAIQDGSTAEEYAADGLTVLKEHKFFDGVWALRITHNTPAE